MNTQERQKQVDEAVQQELDTQNAPKPLSIEQRKAKAVRSLVTLRGVQDEAEELRAQEYTQRRREELEADEEHDRIHAGEMSNEAFELPSETKRLNEAAARDRQREDDLIDGDPSDNAFFESVEAAAKLMRRGK